MIPVAGARAEETFRGIDALIQVGLCIARSAPSGRVLLARIANSIDLEWIPRPWGDAVVAELREAGEEAREEIKFSQIEADLERRLGIQASARRARPGAGRGHAVFAGASRRP
jgi:hypothetical protein